MRLRLLKEGYGRLAKAQLRLIELVIGQVPGPIRVTMYRKKFFGEPFSRCLQETLRGESFWTAHEHELFAAFVSRVNQCPY